VGNDAAAEGRMSVPGDALLHLTLLGEAALNADCAVFVANEEGQIVAVNDLLCDLLDLEREALLAKRLDDVVAPGSYEAIETRVASQPYLLGFFVPEVASHRRHRRRG
jgi:PAS domain-containing protein